MSTNELVIKGARQNNLKNVSLRLPHNRMIAVTGISGSGKSSLAFETIFAEGQWRFIESLSTYARLFLEKLDRPDVDAIQHIRPAIALEQRNPVRGSRSTVGTLTELFDLFRLLYAKIGQPYCPACGAGVRKWDASSIVSHLLENHIDMRAMVTFESGAPLQELKARGLQRVMVNGVAEDIDSPEAAALKPPYEVVLDRLIIRNEPRLADSIEAAFREGGGRLRIVSPEGQGLSFSKHMTCDKCGASVTEPSPLLFSFNHPVGACPECKGFGNVLKYDESLIVPDPYLSLAEGAIDVWEKPAARWWKKQFMKSAQKAGIDVNKPFRELSDKERTLIYSGNDDFYGIDSFFDDLESRRYKLHVRVFLARYRMPAVCPACGGKRLSPSALAYKIAGLDISELSDMPIGVLKRKFDDLGLSPYERGLAKEILRQITMKLGFLSHVGLDYLTLTREAKTLSGGEYQRVSLSNQLASRLTGTLYVLDEPTVGLHRRDTDRITDIMRELASTGNTIVVVEHDKAVIEAADWVVELGPGGGHLGGEIVFTGPIDEFRRSDTVTSRYINDRQTTRVFSANRTGKGAVTLKGARGHNLKNVTAEFPLRTLTVVTGVSGSGKSSLIVETLYRALMKELRIGTDTPLPFDTISGHKAIKYVKMMDQTPIGRSPRSNPVTYLKLFDPIRKLFADQPEARAHGYDAGFFSFNVTGGRCETCKGEGYQRYEMYFFEDLYVKCEDCGGTRYSRDALSVTYRGKNIHEVLELTVDRAAALFEDQPTLAGKFDLLRAVGLGYLRLGQSATTLSGGEAQRLKLCAELGPARTRGALYILDEPTVGLHAEDVGKLLRVLGLLVDADNTVIVIEHNLDVARAADWIIDIGPEGGEAGGEIVYAGAPRMIVEEERSYTGRYMTEGR